MPSDIHGYLTALACCLFLALGTRNCSISPRLFHCYFQLGPVSTAPLTLSGLVWCPLPCLLWQCVPRTTGYM